MYFFKGKAYNPYDCAIENFRKGDYKQMMRYFAIFIRQDEFLDYAKGLMEHEEYVSLLEKLVLTVVA